MLPVPYIVRRIWIVFLICPSLIICIRGDCGIPEPVPNTQPVAATSGVTGDTITYVCDRSTGYYELPGKSRTITCQDDNTWTTIPKFCARACKAPDRFPYAVPTEEDNRDIFLNGTTVRYKCRAGFKRAPLSSNVITCRDDFTWSTPTSEFCTRRSCGSPKEAPNAEFEATDGFFFGSKLTYKCNDGYRMESRKDYRDCQEDGSWSNYVPQCAAVICSAPDSPAGGRYSPVKDEYDYQEAVTFSCSSGSHVIGASSASCTSEGTWSARTPNCTAVSCEDPGNVQNGKKISGFGGPYTLDYAVSYDCNTGFVMIGSRTITCTVNNRWTAEPPQCRKEDSPVVSCGDPGEVRHATRSGSQFTVGSRVNYRCLDGYKLTSVSYKECQADGTWSRDEITCTVVSCGDPGDVRHATRSGSQFTVGFKVNYTCLDGYKLTSSISYKECQVDGTWSRDEITCTGTPKDVCHFQVVHSHLLSVKKSAFMPGEVVTHECDTAYSMIGSHILTCSSQGQWNPSPGQCHFIIVPLVITAGVIVGVIAFILYKRSKSKTGEYYCEHKNDIFQQTVEQELIESNYAKENQI